MMANKLATQTLKVSVAKDAQTILSGTFDVSDHDYQAVSALLKEVEMSVPQAHDLLIGYMHARDAGPVSEEMGKLAMFAVVYLLSEGHTDVDIKMDHSEK
ncbi:MAG: hypothetical protein COB37_02845 [Kordiimonadales bacterium]|nr:MAG: hypothetical protein COB37_02845 [Kordiimonadales bacterium]